MTDDAEHMGLMTLVINGIAHGFAIDGKTLVFLSVGFVPTLQGPVQLDGINPDQDVADNRLTGNKVTLLNATATEAPTGILAQAFSPIGHGRVSAHAA
jgi:hypothetical protein